MFISDTWSREGEFLPGSMANVDIPPAVGRGADVCFYLVLPLPSMGQTLWGGALLVAGNYWLATPRSHLSKILIYVYVC